MVPPWYVCCSVPLSVTGEHQYQETDPEDNLDECTRGNRDSGNIGIGKLTVGTGIYKYQREHAHWGIYELGNIVENLIFLDM